MSKSIALHPLNGNDSLHDIIVRTSMSIRTAQSVRTLPIVAITLIALEFALRGRVDALYFHVWAALMTLTTLMRAATCHIIRPLIGVAPTSRLERYEYYMWVSALLNTAVIGSSFWLVASTSDLTVKLVMTLISCFYAIGALVNASSHFPSFAAGIALNLGQGVLFWFGIGHDTPSQPEIALPYLAVALLMVGFGRDNSQVFRDSLRMRKENAELLQQLAADKKTIQSAFEKAHLASDSKSRFLAAASHDLRQPLHAMNMFLGTLTFHVQTDDAKRLLGRVKDTAQILEDQFNSLLDLSKFDAGAVTIDYQNFDLQRLLEKLVEQFRLEAHAKNIELVASLEDATAHSDPLLLERALRNLIGNAVKYTDSGSVTVSCQCHEEDVVVAVRDTGPGIHEDQQVRIFEEYVQLNNPARQRRHGVGLGLAIVKRIDALLDMQLTLNSVVGQGSTFQLRIPLSQSTQPYAEQVRIPSDILTTKIEGAIWILDDDQMVLDALAEQLTSWGAEVTAFTKPTDLLHKLRRGDVLPRWILTDDMLGSALSGLDTAQMLSSEFGFGKICLITGNSEASRLNELRSSGFPVIVKPARPEILAAILSK